LYYPYTHEDNPDEYGWLYRGQIKGYCLVKNNDIAFNKSYLSIFYYNINKL